MKIIHTSDWHLGKNLEQISRIAEQKEFIDCLVNTVKENAVDLVLIAGDIYDTYNPSAASEELFYSALERLNDNGRRGVIVIAGNHDNPDRLCAAGPLAGKNGIFLLGYPYSDAGSISGGNESIQLVASGPGWLELKIKGCGHNAVVITLPYPSEARLEEILCEEADENKLQKAYSEKLGDILLNLSKNFREDTINLIVSHVFMRGGSESESERTLQVGGAMTVDPDILPESTHFAAFGHLHRPQKVKNSKCHAYYSGSPLAYSFSEADHTKAILLITCEPQKEANIEQLYLDCGKPLRKWKAVNGISEALSWCQEGRDNNAWIDLEIYTDRPLSMEEQKKLRDLNPGIINIRPIIKNELQDYSGYINRENRKIDELFRDYYKHQKGMEITGDLMKCFLEIINEEEENGLNLELAGGDEL